MSTSVGILEEQEEKVGKEGGRGSREGGRVRGMEERRGGKEGG